MACNDNVVKNMANEITRNCQAHNVSVDPEFVIYLIDLLLLNPKYGKLFSKTINRDNLAFFVEECGRRLTRGGTSLNTLKIQFILQTNYDKLSILINKHLMKIESCLKPLTKEILDEDPDPGAENEMKKLFRKISIYIILSSGLGNPGMIQTLKEGMAALESVFSMDDLRIFLALPQSEKYEQLQELLEVVSGVRLFNRDCNKGGDAIPNLPFNLIDAGKACLTSLSNALIAVMQRVNSLTTAIEGSIKIDDETGNVQIAVRNPKVTIGEYKQIFELLIFNRQYEVFIRKLLSDMETMVQTGSQCVARFKKVLEDLHEAVKYKAAVPVVTVFPLFSKVWRVWRSMQNVMYLNSLVSRLMSALSGIQEHVLLPFNLIDDMLAGRMIMSDEERITSRMTLSIDERLTLSSIKSYVGYSDTCLRRACGERVEFLGFCALCLSVGALVPSNMRVGQIKHRGGMYGFCSVKMAVRFNADPERYVNEVLNYARIHPQLINLLDIKKEVYDVREIDNLIVEYIPKTQVFDKDIQTDTHPIEEYMEKNYTSDLWKWKRRACQWANIVNCKTHSTQTIYSHLRSEIHCQTFEYRDKVQQTKAERGVNTDGNNQFLWGLRGQLGAGQHAMDVSGVSHGERTRAQVLEICEWPCIFPKKGSARRATMKQSQMSHSNTKQ